MTFAKVCKLTEDGAREYLEKLRWPDGPECAHCSCKEVTKLKGKATRPGVYKCKGCRKQFTVTVGTIFHRSKISLKQWVMAFSLATASKKGISSHQLYRMLGLGSYRSAWFLQHRIRHAMGQEPLKALMQGIVEADETWIGPKNTMAEGHQTENKTAVMALVERDTGRVHARVIGRVTKENLRKVLDEKVSKDARLMTDELQAYVKPGPEFQSHETVCHSRKEYARGDVHVNNCEGFFGLLKRGLYGTYHHVDDQHLHRYVDEFGFKWSHRTLTDGERMEAALRLAPRGRLTYRKLGA